MDELTKNLLSLLQLDSEAQIAQELAAGYFSGKLDLTPREFYQLESKYRSAAFTVSGYTALSILNTFHSELTRAIEDGTTQSDFKRTMDDFLERNGYTKLHPLQAENIFSTNVQTAYNVGAYEEMTNPAVKKARPYWRYDAVEDSKTRPAHRAMNGKVYPADSPVWDTWYPPNGFRCRCSVSTLSQRDVDRHGLAVETEVPHRISNGIDMVPMVPDRDFNHNPAKVRFEPDLLYMPEALQNAYRRREKEAREK